MRKTEHQLERYKNRQRARREARKLIKQEGHMDWQEKLNKAANDYNALNAEEARFVEQLAAVRTAKDQAWGRAHATQQLFQEFMAEKNAAASENGSGDHEAVAVPATASDEQTDLTDNGDSDED